MLITRTPLRISFFGGSTDYPIWYQNHPGAVISTTIDKYAYITCRYLPQFFEYKYLIKYSAVEKVTNVHEIQHPSVRETLKFLKIPKGVEISHTSDVPAMAGLGSSSAFTVGLVHALQGLLGKQVSKRQLALDAIHIEQKKIKEHVGSQDQVAASFGGLNKIEFGGHKTFNVKPIIMPPDRLKDLQSHLMLFFSGISREASKIAKEQNRLTKKNSASLNQMLQLVTEAETILSSRSSLNDFGRLLDESWKIKRQLTNKITTPLIDEIYTTAKAAGALGGKLLGAGGGGFMLLFVKPGNQSTVRRSLKNLLHVPFAFENSGSQLIYYAPTSDY
jgi:D-glycero-alpha-D-manno-heptose-7-phosphate kinase